MIPTPLSDAPILTFVGGAGTVTGSKYLMRAAGQQILLDCGLFQGLKPLRLRNWDRPTRAADGDSMRMTIDVAHSFVNTGRRDRSEVANQAFDRDPVDRRASSVR